jgi:steroid 5-alpha reductase family enzyme
MSTNITKDYSMIPTNSTQQRTRMMVKCTRLRGRVVVGGSGGFMGAALLLLVLLAAPPLIVIHGTLAFETSSSRVVVSAPVQKGLTNHLFRLDHQLHQQQQKQHGLTSSPSRRHHNPLAVRGGGTGGSAFPLHAVPAAAAAAAAAGVVVIPSLKTIALSCLLPTSLGYIKSEYGVSYGYGTSIAILAYSILQQQLVGTSSIWTMAAWTWPALHAAALLFYGLRLDVFLLYRELCIPRFRKFRETIEKKAPPNRASRTPFILSCALLYACMASPLFVTATTTTTSVAASSVAVQVSIVLTWAGFLMAALGDWTKSVGKARRGEDALITNGIFRFFRHPNYTGEILGWTASCVAAFAAAFANGGNNFNSWKVPTHVCISLTASIVGLAGIILVLAMATKGLEKKQKEKYGDSDEYKQWVKRSWVGISL